MQSDRKPKKERRRYPRCSACVTVSLSPFSKSDRLNGTALDYSRFGMLIKSPRAFKPGTTIVIRLKEWPTKRTDSAIRPERSLQAHGAKEMESSPCMEIKNLVTAQVVRCTPSEPDAGHYRVGVRYVDPAV